MTTDLNSSSQSDQSPSWVSATANSDNGNGNGNDNKIINDNKNVSKDAADDEQYIPSSAMSCPPLVRLQAYGLCCPFIETEEEHDARVGVNHLQNYPITWYRKKLVEDVAKDVKDAVPSSGGLMNGIGQLLGSNGRKSEIPMAYVGVPGTLGIVDTDDHGPVIQIRTLEIDDPTNTEAKDAVNNYITSGRPWWEEKFIKDKAPSRVIPLYMVDKVTSGWSITNDQAAGGVKLYAAPPSKGFLSGLGPELLRFDTLGGGGNTLSGTLFSGKPDEPNKYSDKVIVQLKSLVDWNRRRMAKDIKHGKIGVAPKSNSPGYVTMS